ncbi:hypothetical protein V6N11_029249 [Hibiscus sabdariffa]|uniref:Leucine-rich repeat-containing N-terminal plant-type domain-containing protein n=1 Tax=Hibiscus sabdariffa TaxID=183260 RepID=A0ABR2A8Z4_9ROSI
MTIMTIGGVLITGAIGYSVLYSRKKREATALDVAKVTVGVADPSDTHPRNCPPSDRAALLAFKSALHEPYLGIFNSWTGTDCCRNWYGVSCDQETYRVADINLRGESEDPIFERAHRTGFISPEICKLARLSSITIADWKGITGEIPKCITGLPFLRILDLIGNRISGEIPADIGRLERLTVLNVADNQLTGRIPVSLTNLSNLMHLDLRNNKISGPIPSRAGDLNMLSRALLSGNQISGSIPSRRFGPLGEQNIGADSSLLWENGGARHVEFGLQHVNGFDTGNPFNLRHRQLEPESKRFGR